jgi:hypothetical protein
MSVPAVGKEIPLRRLINRQVILLALFLAAIGWWLLIPPFFSDSNTSLYTETRLRPDGPTSYYNPGFFYIGILVWGAGVAQLVWMFFGDLVRASSEASIYPEGKVVEMRTGRHWTSQGSPRSPAMALMLVPVDTFGRLVAYGLFYAVGLRALDIDGMIRQGQTLVRTDALAAFSRGAQFVLVAFFNTASLVGEFSTFEIRSWPDVIFTIVNVVARFFAIFLVINVAFLRLSAMLNPKPQSPDIRADKQAG